MALLHKWHDLNFNPIKRYEVTFLMHTLEYMQDRRT